MTDRGTRADDAGAGWRRVVPAAAALAAFLLMTSLYLRGAAAYHPIFHLWGVDSWSFPFLDIDHPLSAIRCLQQGIDPYTANPCDLLDRVYDYSPLWLALAAVLPTGNWMQPVGLGVDLAFFASLLLLPRGRAWRHSALITLGVLSPASVFAAERANNDLVIFVLAALSATLWRRSLPLRGLGYACALLAGLLKYYPLALMALACRETPRVFAVVALGAAAALAAFIAWSGYDLIRALRLIPAGGYFDDMVGSSTLGGGLAELAGAPDWVAAGIRLGLTVGAIAIGLRLGARATLQADVGRLTESEQAFLMTGALLVLAFFFTAQNIGYRVVHLVLTLPALLALARIATQRRLFQAAAAIALCLLWAQAWREALSGVLTTDSAPIIALGILPPWLLREAMWWTLIPILIGVLTALLRRSTMAEWLWALRPAGQSRRGTT